MGEPSTSTSTMPAPPPLPACHRLVPCHPRAPAAPAEQEWNEIQYNGVYYEPPEVGAPGEVHPDKAYTFKYPRPPRPRALRIYECHVGMSSQEPKVNSYLEFKDEMLPRIRWVGCCA